MHNASNTASNGQTIVASQAAPTVSRKRKLSVSANELVAERDGHLPVWIRPPKSGPEHYCGFTRAELYELAGDGKIRSVSSRAPGQVKGVHLFHLGSILQFVERCEAEKNRPTVLGKVADYVKEGGGNEMKRDKVFISYSHKDAKFLDELLVHLKPFERARLIATWSDKQITPGSEWFNEIKAALTSAKVAVMMVSPGFLASDFIYEYELGPLLKEVEQCDVRILWIPIRACAYKETPLKNYQAVISPDKPLAQMRAKRDEAWVKVCEEIKKALNPQ